MLRVFLLLALPLALHGQTAVTWVPCANSQPYAAPNSGVPYGPFPGASAFDPTSTPFSSCTGVGIHYVSICTTPDCYCDPLSPLAGSSSCLLQSYVPSNCIDTCFSTFTPLTSFPACELGYGALTGTSPSCQVCPTPLETGKQWATTGSCVQTAPSGTSALSFDFTGAPVDGVFFLSFGAGFSGPYSPGNVSSSQVASFKSVIATSLAVNAADILSFAMEYEPFLSFMGFPPMAPSGGRRLLQSGPNFVMYVNVTSTGVTASTTLLTAFNTLTAGPPPTPMATVFPGATQIGWSPGVMTAKVIGGPVYAAPPAAPLRSPSPLLTPSPSPSPSPAVVIPTAGAVPVDYVQPYTTLAAQQAALTSINLTTLSTANAAAALLQAAYSLNDASSPLNANATAATALRDTLLDKLVTSSLNFSAVGATELTTLATSVSSLVGKPEQISAAGAASALSLLSQISASGGGSGAPLSSSTGNAVALGLSSIVSAATSGSNAAVPASALASVFDVVNTLSTSLVTGVAAGAAPVEILSAAVQMRLQVDVPTADNRLFSAGLTAPGSASAFDPLPPNIFAGVDTSAGVSTQFVSLTFDPFGATDTSGVTRLAFSSATSGAEVPVSGLSTPIKFTIKAPSGLADGTKAQCQFWDTTAKAYSTVGCVGIPQPQPPGHVLDWVAGYTVATDAQMAKAWSITGPLMANCAAQILDCSLPNPGVIMPNPAQPFAVPGVSCNKSLSTAPKLVLVGSQCKMIQAGNNVSCAWDNLKSAFVGAGCVATGGPVDCACRHLTDFAGASKPSIPTASLSDMLSLDPADIVSVRARVMDTAARLSVLTRRAIHSASTEAHAAVHRRHRPLWRHEPGRAAGLRPGRARAPCVRGRAAAPRGGLPRGGRRLALALQPGPAQD